MDDWSKTWSRRALMITRGEGDERAIELSASPMRTAAGEIAGAAVLMHDVTELRGFARQLSYQATHDALTGLVNRREFERRLDEAISTARRGDSTHILCYLDLDNFKTVNDTSGHLAGDGSFTKQCSRWLEARTGASRALLTHSCTAALEMAAILADLKPGDLIEAGRASNYGERTSAVFVYLTATLDAATWGAELAIGDGPGRIYIVEPTGAIEDDPNLTDRKFPGNPTQSYRSREPFRVVGEVREWQGHPPERLQQMRDFLADLKRRGIEAIDE